MCIQLPRTCQANKFTVLAELIDISKQHGAQQDLDTGKSPEDVFN